MLSVLAAILSTQTSAAWYGPATASFPASAVENPYDPQQNDAWVVFRSGATVEKRLAYFDQGTWKSVLVAHHPGAYSARLTINGRAVGSASNVTLQSKLADGFVRRGGRWGFQFDSGKLYWPLGHDLGWQSGNGFPDLTDFLATMGKNGINWSRIWACAWDGKNPWWPTEGTKLPIGQLWPKAIARWDAIVSAAEKAGVHFNFVLFHHGEFSSDTDSNWRDNPWNRAKGGFLEKPDDFFTNPHAKDLAREWVRYAVARWGHSPAIMGWEIFNEVQWTDGAKHAPKVVGQWHDDMADYIRSIDAVKHLVTTSSEMSLPIWNKVDYYQPHGYPARVESMVLAMKSPDSRPLFFGEIGPGQLMGGGMTQIEAVRDGIWSGLLALQAGAAEYWTWDLIPRYNLHREYALARKILNESGVLNEDGLARLDVELDAPKGGDMKLMPGAGWEPNRTFEINLPHDATSAMGGFSTYFQGKGHSEMRPRPVTLTFDAPKQGAMKIGIVGMSGGGGNLKVTVNGTQAAERSWPAGAKIQGVETIAVRLPAGRNTVTLDNDGPDWVQIGSIDIPGIAPIASAVAIGNHRMALMRIERPSGAPAASIHLSGLSLADGTYTGISTDLATGNAEPVRFSIRNGQSTGRMSVISSDSILWVRSAKG